MIEVQNFSRQKSEFEISKGNLKLSVFWLESQFLSKPFRVESNYGTSSAPLPVS